MHSIYYSIHYKDDFIKKSEKITSLKVGMSMYEKSFLEENFADELETGLIIPIKTVFKEESNKKKVLVLEPHPDDGVYSVGGTLVDLASDGYEIISLCLFSNGGASEIRQSENILVYNDIFKSQCIFAPFYDVIYRNDDANNSERKNELSNFFSVRAVIAETINSIKPDIILAPSAIGFHPDHVITNSALLSILKPDTNYKLWFYEDFPYCNENRYKYIKALSDLKSRVKLVPQYNDISHTLYDKVSLYMTYLSQHSQKRKEVHELLFELGSAIQIEGQLENADVMDKRQYERVWCVDNK